MLMADDRGGREPVENAAPGQGGRKTSMSMAEALSAEERLSHRFEIVDPVDDPEDHFDATVAIIGPEVDDGEDQILPVFHVRFEPDVNGDPRGTLESMLSTSNAAMALHLEGKRS